MADLSAKVAYLKGLCDGMKFDTNTNEGKLITSIIDVLNDFASEIERVAEEQVFLSEQVDDMQEDIDFIGSTIVKGLEPGMFDENTVKIKCPNCNEEIMLDVDEIDDEITCPSCGEEIEFDFDCDCGCDDCDH